MNKTKTILVIIGSYVPGFKGGGPIRSVANLVELLGDEFNFKIITANHDLGDVKPYPGITSNAWCRVGKADVYYASKNELGFRALIKLINSVGHDILYLNSVFCLEYTIKPLLLRRLKLISNTPVILAPRGMFSLGALKLKGLKKRTYLLIAGVVGLYEKITWQASSSFEEADILRVFSRAKVRRGSPIVVAPDLLSPRMGESQPVSRIKKRGELNIVFVSRISPKKNLDGALSMLKGLQGDITFHIYGPAEDKKYWQTCQNMYQQFSSNLKVVFHGEIEHDRVLEVFNSNHLFFFPTLGENFGHVILEALLGGCPVLLSDQTPWRDLENLGIGWDIPLDRPDKFKEALRSCVEMDNNQFSEISKRASDFAKCQLDDSAILEQNRSLFRSAIMGS